MQDMALGKMLGMFSGMLPKAKPPANTVSCWLSEEIEKLYPGENEIMDMVKGLVIGMANGDPNGALRVLVTLHNDIGDLVTGLQREGEDGAKDQE